MIHPWVKYRPSFLHIKDVRTMDVPAIFRETFSWFENMECAISPFKLYPNSLKLPRCNLCMCQSHMRKMVWRPKACTSVHTGSLAAGITGNSIYRLQKRSLRSGQFTDSLCRLFSQNKNKVGNSVAKKSAIWKKNDFTENHNHSTSSGVPGVPEFRSTSGVPGVPMGSPN